MNHKISGRFSSVCLLLLAMGIMHPPALLAQTGALEELHKLDNDQSLQAIAAMDCMPGEPEMHSSDQEVSTFQARLLFAYSNPEIERQLDKKDLIRCHARIYQIEEQVFLLMTLDIYSLNAKRSFGDIAMGATMKLYMANDDHLLVRNVERDRGRLDRKAGLCRYKAVLALEKKDIKLLQKHDLSKIGFMWGEGYQEYHIQNIDLVKNQLNCLK